MWKSVASNALTLFIVVLVLAAACTRMPFFHMTEEAVAEGPGKVLTR